METKSLAGMGRGALFPLSCMGILGVMDGILGSRVFGGGLGFLFWDFVSLVSFFLFPVF